MTLVSSRLGGEPIARRNAELSQRATTDRERKHTANADDCDRKRHRREPAEHERIQSIRSENFGANVFGGVLRDARRVGSDDKITDDLRNRIHERVRIALWCEREETPAEHFRKFLVRIVVGNLTERVIDR